MSSASEKEPRFYRVVPECLCNVDLPHASEHAQEFQRQALPTVQFPSEGVAADDQKEARLQDILHHGGEYAKLREKFEKRAMKLMSDLKAAGQVKDQQKQCEKNSGEGDAEKEAEIRLKYELEHSRFQLANVRNQLHSLKKELDLYRRLVRKEVGGGYNVHVLLTDTKWKGRAEEIEKLKSELTHLESKAYGQKYLKNPVTIPQYNPRFPRIEDLVPKQQVDILKKAVEENKNAQEGKEVSALMEEYGNLALVYKAACTHNKILAQELRSLQEELKTYESKEKEDKEIIKELAAHQAQLKEMFDREAHLSNLVHKKQNAPANKESNQQIDAAKYKTMWEVSEYQKKSLLEMVHLLTDRLEDLMQNAEEAEKHCVDNQERQRDLEKEIQDELDSQKSQKSKDKKSKDKKSKDKKSKGQSPPKQIGRSLVTAEQLEVVREENEFLKAFLRRAIEAKQEDIKLYMFAMKSIRGQYLEAMEKIKKGEGNSNNPGDNQA